MDTVERFAPDSVNDILDLGCGTGRFSQGLAARFEASVVGLDPSVKMLSHAVARRHGSRICYANAAAEFIPLPDASIDVVFLSMVFHHFSDRSAAASECGRVLRKSGRVFMRFGTSDRMPEYPYVPFFPSSLPLLADTLPSLAEQCRVFEAAGLRKVVTSVVVQQVAEDYSAYADKLEAGGDSVLVRLSPAELANGLKALRAVAASKENRAVTEPIDIAVFEPRSLKTINGKSEWC